VLVKISMLPIPANLKDVLAVGILGKDLLEAGEIFSVAPPVFRHPETGEMCWVHTPTWDLNSGYTKYDLSNQPEYVPFSKAKHIPESHALFILGLNHPSMDKLAAVMGPRLLCFTGRSAIYHGTLGEWEELWRLSEEISKGE
jgi:hypothetical protein